MTTATQPWISVVIPIKDERDNLLSLTGQLTKVLQGREESKEAPFEIIYVDDGSTDGSSEILDRLAAEHPAVRVLHFDRNYGQSAGFDAGFKRSSGALIVTMDGDLQNDPADIAEFLAKINEGYDIVVGWRHNRQDKLVSRKIPSKIANWLIGKVTGVPIRDNGCSLKAYRGSLIKEIPLYSEMHRFIPAMASIAGPRIAEIRVRHHARKFGKSKYGLSRVYKVLLDLLVIKTVASFTSRPLLWFAMLSLPALVIACVALSYTAFYTLRHGSMPLPIAGTGLIFLASAFISVLSGALGELVYKLGDLREHDFARLTQRVADYTVGPRGALQ